MILAGVFPSVRVGAALVAARVGDYKVAAPDVLALVQRIAEDAGPTVIRCLFHLLGTYRARAGSVPYSECHLIH